MRAATVAVVRRRAGFIAVQPTARHRGESSGGGAPRYDAGMRWPLLPIALESLAFEAAAIPEPALGATGLVLSVRVTAAARLPEPVEVDFKARVRGRPSGPGFVAWDADDDDSFDESWDERVALRNGRAIA